MHYLSTENSRGTKVPFECRTYASFPANVKEFKQVNQLPVLLPLEQGLDVDQLVENLGKWHKLCHLKFSVSKLHCPDIVICIKSLEFMEMSILFSAEYTLALVKRVAE